MNPSTHRHLCFQIEKDVMSSFNWVKSYDYRRMCDFWTNLVDGEQVYEEPFLPYTHERTILGFRCRVYWPVQREWYEEKPCLAA